MHRVDEEDVMVGKEEVVFCTNLTGVAETEAEYALFMHEAEVFLYPLASAVEEGKMTADEAREMFGSYRDLMPEIYDLEEMKEYENGFLGMDWFILWAPGPGSEDFWREAYALGVPGVIYSEGDHPAVARTSRSAARIRWRNFAGFCGASTRSWFGGTQTSTIRASAPTSRRPRQSSKRAQDRGG